MVRVKLNRNRCIGAETCIQIAPTAFKWLDDELAKVDLLDPTSVEEDTLREAAAACPTLAITIVEDEDEGIPGLHPL